MSRRPPSIAIMILALAPLLSSTFALSADGVLGQFMRENADAIRAGRLIGPELPNVCAGVNLLTGSALNHAGAVGPDASGDLINPPRPIH